MLALEARDLWLGELTTNGASPWTIRNYTAVTTTALGVVASRRKLAVEKLKLDVIDHDDAVAARGLCRVQGPCYGVYCQARSAHTCLVCYWVALVFLLVRGD